MDVYGAVLSLQACRGANGVARTRRRSVRRAGIAVYCGPCVGQDGCPWRDVERAQARIRNMQRRDGARWPEAASADRALAAQITGRLHELGQGETVLQNAWAALVNKLVLVSR